MAIVINGSGTVTGLAVGGLPDGTVDAGTLATNSVDSAEIVDGSVDRSKLNTSIADSGNATAITINATENVGIGVTPETWKTTWSGLQVGGMGTIGGETAESAGNQISISNNTYLDQTGSWYYKMTDEASQHQQADGEHVFRVAPSGTADTAISWTTAMTINNAGHVNIGSSTATQGTLNAKGYEKKACDFRRYNSTGEVIHFEYNDGTVGSISVTGSNTAYNTSSDYRLKENVDYTWDATTRLKQLKPARFNFISDDTNTLVDGFIAHEVSSVVPEAITGAKDAMRDETDEEGNVTSVPDMQGIDQSKLVPLLVKTIQELEARITALEA